MRFLNQGSLVFCCFFAAIAGSCGDDMTAKNVDVDYSSLVTGARAGHIEGDVGPVEDLDTPAARLGAWDDGTYLAVEAVARTEGRAVMTFLSASNTDGLFVPGSDETYDFGVDKNGGSVSVLGCVGQDIDIYDQYDAPADRVRVVVEEVGPDTADVSVTVTGTWYVERPGVPTTERTATTSFILER